MPRTTRYSAWRSVILASPPLKNPLVDTVDLRAEYRRHDPAQSPTRARRIFALTGLGLFLLSTPVVASRVGAAAGTTTPAITADGWFVTSDRGVLGPAGELYVLGRTDLVIITGGEKVDPEEVERALRTLPQVRDACVFGLPSGEFGQRVVAVVVPMPTAPDLTLEHLTVQLDLQLSRFKIPRALVTAAALPLTASGKLDRQACVTEFGRWF